MAAVGQPPRRNSSFLCSRQKIPECLSGAASSISSRISTLFSFCLSYGMALISILCFFEASQGQSREQRDDLPSRLFAVGVLVRDDSVKVREERSRPG